METKEKLSYEELVEKFYGINNHKEKISSVLDKHNVKIHGYGNDGVIEVSFSEYLKDVGEDEFLSEFLEISDMYLNVDYSYDLLCEAFDS